MCVYNRHIRLVLRDVLGMCVYNSHIRLVLTDVLGMCVYNSHIRLVLWGIFVKKLLIDLSNMTETTWHPAHK